MNWEAAGAIAEIVGSAAVVITIAYLAVQIRQSTKSARSDSANQSRAAVNDVLSNISNDTESVKTYTKGLIEPDALEFHERIRFDLMIFQTLRVTETIFIEHQNGFVETEMWEAQWRAATKILGTKGGRQSWNRQKELVSATFMEWVDANLE